MLQMIMILATVILKEQTLYVAIIMKQKLCQEKVTNTKQRMNQKQ